MEGCRMIDPETKSAALWAVIVATTVYSTAWMITITKPKQPRVENHFELSVDQTAPWEPRVLRCERRLEMLRTAIEDIKEITVPVRKDRVRGLNILEWTK
jgi:hypothetical protein